MNLKTFNENIILITGATNGIGKVAALELARQGATVVLVGRNPQKTADTVAEIKQTTGNQQVDYLLADLSSLADVHRLVAEFRQKYSRLDVLINNAGVILSKREETVDGYEKTFVTNFLSPFLLTTELLDVLKTSTPARIINVSSDGHKNSQIDFDDLGSRSYGSGGLQAYARSKLALVLFTYELARRLEGTGVTANTLHPGIIVTGSGGDFGGFLFKFFQRLMAISPEQGADTIIYLASSPDVEGVTGKYWEKRKAIASSKASYDTETAKRLWEISEQLVNAVGQVQA